MNRNWLIGIVVVVLISALYIIEMSKVSNDNGKLPTLDRLQIDEFSREWDLFYKVRATIIDGQSANFSIPRELKNLAGKELSLSGAAVFFGNGCELVNDTTIQIKSFFLQPTLGLANSCVLNPAEAMRWTIMVNLEELWFLSRSDMIDTEAIVTGKFKIDTSNPYEAAFYLENASAKLK
jgi:hypothetical protein